MTQYRRRRGQAGEAIAARYLINQQYQILARNFRTKHGEIDIIAHDSIQDHLVFVEVKSYQLGGDVHPAEVITHRKAHHLVKTAEYYLLTQARHDIQCGFDLMIISQHRIHSHLENIIS